MANEKRLIPIDTIFEGIKAFKCCYEENEKELSPLVVNVACRALTMVEQFVKETPTVDAVEVVHGRWLSEPVEFTYEKDIKCSVCGRYVDEPENYCPNCGAKMDGERKTDG